MSGDERAHDGEVHGDRDILVDVAPMKVARWILRRWALEGRNLRVWRGEPWEWYGGQWRRRDRKWLQGAVWLSLEDAVVREEVDGAVMETDLSPTFKLVTDTVEALDAVARLPVEEVPTWVARPPTRWEGVPVSDVVAFEDKLVRVSTGEMVDRGPEWFDTSLVGTVAGGGPCPTWERCLGEWGGGDPTWVELLARMMGYAMLNHRRYQRWFLLHGRVRGGKGTIMRVLGRMLPGLGVGHVSLRQLGDRYGLWGREASRVISVSEVGEVRGAEGHLAGQVLKAIVGGDPLTVERKYLEPVRDMRVRGVLVAQANEVPHLPNRGQGVASKMVVLPFQESWLGREDFELDRKLEAEMAGIAWWALQGARRLEKEEDPLRKWPIPKGALEVVEAFQTVNNPYDGFLEACFERTNGGFVPSETIWAMWQRWSRDQGVERVSSRRLLVGVVEETSWNLKRGRMGKERIRGVWGLTVRGDHMDRLF